MRRVPDDRDRLERDARVFADPALAVVLDPVDQRGSVLGALLELDARVEVFRVLADDDEVDARVAGADALVALARAHLAVEVEGLAERDIDAAEARSDRRRDRALERDAVLLDRLQNVVGKRVAAVLVHDVGARPLHVPVELDAGGVEDPARCLGKLRPGAVAGNEGHAMSHGRGVMVAEAVKRSGFGTVLCNGRKRLQAWPRGRRRLRDRDCRARQGGRRAPVPRGRHRGAGRPCPLREGLGAPRGRQLRARDAARRERRPPDEDEQRHGRPPGGDGRTRAASGTSSS